jgi:hypothetical protein
LRSVSGDTVLGNRTRKRVRALGLQLETHIGVFKTLSALKNHHIMAINHV